MISVTATIDKLPFIGVTENWNAIVNTAFRKYSEDVVLRAKENVVSGRVGLVNRTGKLANSIRLISFSQFSPNTGATAVIGAGDRRTPYASTHEFGAVIKPVRGKYLTFKLPAGNWVKVQQVTIPARPYLRPAGRDLEPKFDGYLSDALERILGKL